MTIRPSSRIKCDISRQSFHGEKTDVQISEPVPVRDLLMSGMHLDIWIPLTPFLGERGGREVGEGVVGRQLPFGALLPQVHLIMTVAEQSDNALLWSSNMQPKCKEFPPTCAQDQGAACVRSLPSYAGLQAERAERRREQLQAQRRQEQLLLAASAVVSNGRVHSASASEHIEHTGTKQHVEDAKENCIIVQLQIVLFSVPWCPPGSRQTSALLR